MIVRVNVVLDRTVIVDSHWQQQQSYLGLRSPGRSNSALLWNDSWIQAFHSLITAGEEKKTYTLIVTQTIYPSTPLMYCGPLIRVGTQTLRKDHRNGENTFSKKRTLLTRITKSITFAVVWIGFKYLPQATYRCLSHYFSLFLYGSKHYIGRLHELSQSLPQILQGMKNIIQKEVHRENSDQGNFSKMHLSISPRH